MQRAVSRSNALSDASKMTPKRKRQVMQRLKPDLVDAAHGRRDCINVDLEDCPTFGVQDPVSMECVIPNERVHLGVHCFEVDTVLHLLKTALIEPNKPFPTKIDLMAPSIWLRTTPGTVYIKHPMTQANVPLSTFRDQVLRIVDGPAWRAKVIKSIRGDLVDSWHDPNGKKIAEAYLDIFYPADTYVNGAVDRPPRIPNLQTIAKQLHEFKIEYEHKFSDVIELHRRLQNEFTGVDPNHKGFNALEQAWDNKVASFNRNHGLISHAGQAQAPPRAPSLARQPGFGAELPRNVTVRRPRPASMPSPPPPPPPPPPAVDEEPWRSGVMRRLRPDGVMRRLRP